MSAVTCYECSGSGEHEYCLDCDLSVQHLCECDSSSGSYTEDCEECNGDGEIEDDE